MAQAIVTTPTIGDRPATGDERMTMPIDELLDIAALAVWQAERSDGRVIVYTADQRDRCRQIATAVVTAWTEALARDADARAQYLSANRYTLQEMTWREAMHAENAMIHAAIWLRTYLPAPDPAAPGDAPQTR